MQDNVAPPSRHAGQAPLQPHPIFITTSEGGKLAWPFGPPPMLRLCLISQNTARQNKSAAKLPSTGSVHEATEKPIRLTADLLGGVLMYCCDFISSLPGVAE